MDLWVFAKALGRHWWALLSCAVFTGIGVYAALSGKGNQWVVLTSGVAALLLLIVAAYLAWKEEHQERLHSERAFDWLDIGARFKELNDGGAVVARWSQDSQTKQYSWEVMGGSKVLSVLCVEMCKQAGRRFLDSTILCSKFPDIAEIPDDGDRWLILIRENLNMGNARGTFSSVQYEKKSAGEFGEVANLTGASQALCLRLSNDERS
jgi:hypothetical protein